ncbi:MAG TPA: AAA family ATPase [Allosphingosinicella sp.]
MGRMPTPESKIPSERRIITVLAVDIVGSTRHIADCDPEDAQSFFDRCFEHMREMIERAGGAMVSFEGDGGIAAFGWPVAHEDHADRACAAAWSIQHAGDAGPGPDGRPVRFRIGLHSGLVALRRLRRGGRSRLDTVGATVHIAAKLQQRAPPGGVLISVEAAKLCRSRLELAPEEFSAADGPGTQACRLEAPPESPKSRDVAHRYTSPMIGRQPELAALHPLLPRPGGASHAVALVGEPGIGKSRLAAAAVGEALALEARILVFFGDAQKRTTPFAAARTLIGEALGLEASMLSAAMQAALAAAGFEEADIAAIEAVLSARRGKRHGGARLTDIQLARLLVRAFCTLALGRPTLLLVEDLHLIDAESRQFLRLLAGEAPPEPLCLLLTARPEAGQQAGEIAHRVVPLEPLPRNAMKALGRLLWPDGRVPGAMLERLVDRADGIPFVLEELVRSLGSKAAGGAEVLPQTVESLIHARLQRLSPGARALAEALSLLGENVDIGFLSDVLGQRADPLSDDLEELERYAFVHPPAGGFTHMRHQIIAEACADTIPRQRRRQLHRSAVEAIAARHPGLSGRYEQLAHHAEGAGDLEAALGYLWEAALEARRSSATQSLNLIFDRAIGLVDRIGDAAQEKYLDFVLLAGTSMLQLGEFDKVNLHLPRAMELARRSGQPALISGTLSQIGMVCWFEGRYEEGLRATEEGLAIARQLQSPALIFSSLIMQTNILHGMGRVDRAIAEQRELCAMLTGALETARLGAASLPSATALSFLSWFLLEVGAYEEGLVHLDQALALAQREGDAYAEVLARNALGRNLLMLHRNEEAVECIAVARAISERNGYDAIKADLDGRMAIALSRSGRPAEAVRLVEECMRRKLHRRTGQLEVYYLQAGYAEALMRVGEMGRGLDILGEALARARGIGNPWLTVDALGLRARMLAELAPGDPRIAEDLAERAQLCARHGLAAWPEATCPGRPSRVSG